MTTVEATTAAAEAPQDDLASFYEAIVIGAGVCGIYQIKRLQDLGIDSVVLDTAGDVGGTWYWNRYPGARFDSESYTYGYSWSQEVLDEWHWKERFSPQPETLKYLQFVTDKFDLRKHMRFNITVEAMDWNEADGIWELSLADGRKTSCRFVIMGVGLLSVPTPPRIEGMDDFEGQSWHTFHWPKEPVDLAGKRVAVIGTGATGIQVIGAIAPEVGSLTVFQRRPNWSSPLHNAEISEEEMQAIRDRYDEIFETCARTPGGFEHEPDRRGFWNLTREERHAAWDELYEMPGFAIWLRNFVEIFVDEKANAEFSEWMADKIRSRVNDPEVAEKLVPKDHGFGVQRVPMETNYFDAYNQDNVELVDITENPIERMTANGIRTTEAEYEFDIVVFATGFDAVTGAFDQIDITGVDGVKLRERWSDGPVTYLGMFVHGFPNMVMPTGPQSGSASTNFPRGIESGVGWTTEMLEYLLEHDKTRFDATPEAEEEWTEHVAAMYDMVLMRKAKGWFTGYNSNVEGHEEGTLRYMVYNGGAPKYMRTLREVADEGYRGLRLD